MNTRTARRPRFTVEDVHRILDGPLELVIDGAVTYWLEGDAGHILSAESSRTIEPFARALDLFRKGRDPDTMLLCARLKTGERYEVGGGLPLIDMAEAAVGIRGRPRTPTEA